MLEVRTAIPLSTLSTLSTSSTLSTDVAIVGAGVAGLAAMRVLEEHGIRTCVLEARDRIGGRIHTIRDARVAHPIELGAEFVHGEAPQLIQIIREAGLLAYAVEGDRWRSRGGRLSRFDDFWERLQPVTKRLDGRKADRSFGDFLDEQPGGRGAADARLLARTFVEGFHAADVTRISTRALSDGGIPSDEEEQRQLRIANGYDRVPEWLARELYHRILMETVVERIEWERGGVEISVRQRSAGGTTSIRARAAIITVPLGVLLAPSGEWGAIAFSPALPIIERARRCLTMGSVVRLVILFRERWWTSRMRSVPRNGWLDSLTFLHGDSGNVSIWWSLHPVHVPMIVGWVGGPAAARLSARSREDVQARALAALAENFGVSRRRVVSQVEASWMHDWQHDPFARGVYSYALVGGADGAEKLARSIDGTLWIAGEAADAEGRTGTVHGAIGSGRKAGQAVIRSLARRAASA